MDYTDPNDTLVITYGPGAMVGDVQCRFIEILDDTVLEGLERFLVDLDTNSSIVSVKQPNQSTIHIIDHDDGKYTINYRLIII